MQNSIDVVIPSFRLNEKVLLPIFHLTKPDNFIIQYYLIADNPEIQIPPAIQELASQDYINLIVNETNLGFSATRNKGIDAGKGKWILLLDDDVTPSSDLLLSYAQAVEENANSIGYIGPTDFPEPFNTITYALVYNGSLGHFQSAHHNETLVWAPTANILLNRTLLGKRRFNSGLKYGGEDIDLLVKNSLANQKKYISIPEATVFHPWWDDGKNQLKRLFRYGAGTGDIMKHPHIKPYTYIDFTNTTESLILSIFVFLLLNALGINRPIILLIIPTILFAEFITNVIKSTKLVGYFSLMITWQMFLHKNSYEAGMVWINLKKGRLSNFARRIDLGFSKIGPGHFRLNKWKIIKLCIVTALLIIILL